MQKRDRHITGGSRLAISLLLVVFSCGAVYGGPEDVLTASPYSPRDQLRLIELFNEADAAGLPTEALLERLVEGLSKKVGPGRMEEALRLDIEFLVAAQNLLMESDAAGILETGAAWERAANLLRAGWSPESLMGLAVTCRERPEAFREASIFATTLMDWGTDESVAFDLTRVVVQELDPREFPEVTTLLAVAQQRRIPPAVAAAIIGDGIREGRSIRQLRALINRTN